MVLQSEAERRARPGAGLADVIAGVVRGKPISTDAIFGAVADLFGVFGAAARAQPTSQPPRVDRPPQFDPFSQWYQQQQQRQQEAELPKGPSAEELARARKVFGYAPGETVTKDELKKRFRKLVLKHHPDRKGGSAAKMAEINHSHDLLQALV